VEEDEPEARDEDSEAKSDSVSQGDSNLNANSDSSSDVDQKSQNDQSNNDNPSLVPKSQKKVDSAQDHHNQDQDQTFPQVIGGNRRLIEPLQGVKGRGVQQSGVLNPIGKQHIVYHSVQHAVPVSVQNHIIGGVKRPVIQYQINNPNVVQHTLRRPVQVLQSGVQQPLIGDQRQIQYVIQPVIPQNIGLEQGQVVLQPEVQQILGLGQRNVQLLSGLQQGVGVNQRHIVVQHGVQQVGNNGQNIVQKADGTLQVLQPGLSQLGVGVDQRQVHSGSGVQNIAKSNILEQKHVVQQLGVVSDERPLPVVQSGVHGIGNIKVVQQTVQPLSVVSNGNQNVNHLIGYQYVVPTERRDDVSEQRVIVQSPQRVENLVQVPVSNQAVVVSPWDSQVGWQLSQPNQQYVSGIQQQYVSGIQQQYPVSGIQQQYPVSNIQDYYQSISQSPISSIGQISQPYENQYVSQIGDVSSILQPVQYSGIQGVQHVRRVEQPIESVDNNGNVGQPDISIKPSIVNVVQRPSILSHISGTKSIVNV
jgi:hypothetical protein